MAGTWCWCTRWDNLMTWWSAHLAYKLVPAVFHVDKKGPSVMSLCALGQSNDMTAVPVWRSFTGSVGSVGIRKGRGYLRSLFGQCNDMTVCLVRDRVLSLWWVKYMTPKESWGCVFKVWCRLFGVDLERHGILLSGSDSLIAWWSFD